MCSSTELPQNFGSQVLVLGVHVLAHLVGPHKAQGLGRIVTVLCLKLAPKLILYI